jgi:hypothetical protein
MVEFGARSLSTWTGGRTEAEMAADDLERRVREFVTEQIPWLPFDMPLTTDVLANVYGDDAGDVVARFAKWFRVDISGYRCEYNTGPEGFISRLLRLLGFKLWAKLPHVPIRLADLIESATRGTWSIQYPGKTSGSSNQG